MNKVDNGKVRGDSRGKKSIFLEVTLWVIVGDNNSYEHVPNSKEIPREVCLNVQIKKDREW